MAMQYSPEAWRSLSHRDRRRHVNRERKRWKRKALAQQREKEQTALENDPEYIEQVLREEERLAEERRKEEAQRLLDHELWLQRERIAQEEFRKKREKEEKILREREERERLIREEWEALQRKEREEEEKRERAKQAKEEKLREALSTEDKAPSEPWHNPLAPDDVPTASTSQDYGTERDSRYCAFFIKTGACRFKERCSKLHPRPASSTTLLIPGMYTSLGLRERVIDERDQDAGLEYDEGDIYEHFKQFYDDVLPEFSKAGTLVQFKVSCNYEPHLRGNVYAQYSNEEECAKAYHMFNGRWYAQRQLSCEFCPVQKWKTAICGLFNLKRCPKGKHCNFLHVFKNPNGAFSRADRDLPPLSPPRPARRLSSFSSHRRLSFGSRNRSPCRSWDRRRSRSRTPHGSGRSRRSRSRSPRGSGWSRRSRSKSPRRRRRRSRSRSSEDGYIRETRKRRSISHDRSRDSSEEHGRRKKSKKNRDSSADSASSEDRSRKHKSKKKKKHKHHHHKHSSKHKKSPSTPDGNEQKEEPRASKLDQEEEPGAFKPGQEDQPEPEVNNDVNGGNQLLEEVDS